MYHCSLVDFVTVGIPLGFLNVSGGVEPRDFKGSRSILLSTTLGAGLPNACDFDDHVI